VSRRLPVLGVVAVGLVVAAALVILVAPHASSSPDGLERVAAEQGIDAGARDHALSDGPLADYSLGGDGRSALGTAVAGLAGIAVTFAVGAGAVWVFRRRRHQAAAPVGAARR
jgi:cobalt/nickel transport system permease protein